MIRHTLLAAFAFLASGCATASGLFGRPEPPPSPAAETVAAAEPETAPRKMLPEGAQAPLFNDIGDYHYPVTTSSELAQRYFDQGLILTYGFNHAEAIRSFREAARLDPGCAMCFWGIAYAYGPNINKPMDEADVPAAWEAVQQAQKASAGASPKERDLVAALSKRYAEKASADRAALDQAYAAAMRDVAKRYPDDVDVQALFAESLMDLMPWDYYRADGLPKPETDEAIAALENVLARRPDHAGAIHFYIHAVEASSSPGRAEAPADRLAGLVPGAGHLVHMPSHIYLRVGRYNDASSANQKAAAADESYITQCRVQGFYPALYYPHNIHFLWASASFEGRSETALGAAHRLVKAIPPGMVDDFPIVEEFMPTELFAFARFGKWERILEQPKPDESLRYVTGQWHYVRGVALAATGKPSEARRELEALERLRDAWAKEELVFASGAKPSQLLGIAANVLEGRVAGAEGKWDRAIEPLREAVSEQDRLPYTEPPPWYFPNREALGYALLQAGRAKEAEEVYREQLEITPRNGWALQGLVASLHAQGKEAAARDVKRERDRALELADVEIAASIF